MIMLFSIYLQLSVCIRMLFGCTKPRVLKSDTMTCPGTLQRLYPQSIGLRSSYAAVIAVFPIYYVVRMHMWCGIGGG